MPDRALKIAILGDSSSAGIGDGKAIYPFQLFESLQRWGGARVDTWASPGLTSADACKVYIHQIAERPVDFLVIYLGNNEGSRSRYKGTYRPVRERIGKFFGRSSNMRKPFVLGKRRPYVFEPVPMPSRIATTPTDFYRNLRTIISKAQRAGTQVILVNPVANTCFPAGLGSPNSPFYRYVSFHDTIGPELVADAETEMLVQGLKWHAQSKLQEASDCYSKVRPDPAYCYQVARNNLAVAQYESGEQSVAVRILSEVLDTEYYDRAIPLYNLGRIENSTRILDEAYETDLTLYRIKGAYREAVTRLGTESAIHVLDMADIVTDDHFVDYCHLTRKGHGILAELIYSAVTRQFESLRAPGASTYRCEFPSPDYFFSSQRHDDLDDYYAITAEWSETDIAQVFEETCTTMAGGWRSEWDTEEPSLQIAIRRTVQRALQHPVVTGIDDLVSFPVRFSHEIGSFPEFYLYRLLRAYWFALEKFGHWAEWEKWRGSFPVRNCDDYDHLIFTRSAYDAVEDEVDLSTSRSDRVLKRVEEVLGQPELYTDQSRNRRKTIMYWYTRESFRFGTHSRPSMLYNRVALEELAEGLAVAWIIENLRGRSGAKDRIDWCRCRIEALMGVHEDFASQLVSDDSEFIHQAYNAALGQLYLQ